MRTHSHTRGSCAHAQSPTRILCARAVTHAAPVRTRSHTRGSCTYTHTQSHTDPVHTHSHTHGCAHTHSQSPCTGPCGHTETNTSQTCKYVHSSPCNGNTTHADRLTQGLITCRDLCQDLTETVPQTHVTQTLTGLTNTNEDTDTLASLP